MKSLRNCGSASSTWKLRRRTAATTLNKCSSRPLARDSFQESGVLAILVGPVLFRLALWLSLRDEKSMASHEELWKAMKSHEYRFMVNEFCCSPLLPPPHAGWMILE